MANGQVGAEVQLPADAAAGMSEPRILYSVEEAGRLLSLSASKTRDLVNAGEIRSVRVGRKVLLPRREIEAFADRIQEGEG